jgi:hypothetical protein
MPDDKSAKEDKPRKRGDNWIEIVIATVLSVGGLMTSWASYQAALWDGEQAAHYTNANNIRVIATRTQLEADSRRNVEMAMFNAWLQAAAKGDDTLATFYEQRFPPELKRAFTGWIAYKPLVNPDAPPGPFSSPDYRLSGDAEARRLEARADAAFAQGQRDNAISDLFTQGATFQATGMFFGGIAQVFKVRPVRLTLLAFAVLLCAVGLVRIFSLPVLRPD